MKLLVVRFSALGDVAMTLPVIYAAARTYPDLEISILTRENFAGLFSYLPENVRFIGAALNGRHKGASGLHRLYYDKLEDEDFDYVADLHSVLRTWLLNARFRLAGKRVASIRKGRCAKRKLIRKGAAQVAELPTTIDRYVEVFERLGFPLPSPLSFKSIFEKETPSLAGILPPSLTKKAGDKWVGIAPFARYEGKTYPIELMYEVVQDLSGQPNVHLFLFGAGAERERLLAWSAENPDKIYIPQGRTDIDKELALMSQLDLMISMDSANMHFASLVGVRTLSIWGATHPHAGFLGYGQQSEDCVQLDTHCRPCSVFGNKPCRYKTYACLYAITPSEITNRVVHILS